MRNNEVVLEQQYPSLLAGGTTFHPPGAAECLGGCLRALFDTDNFEFQADRLRCNRAYRLWWLSQQWGEESRRGEGEPWTEALRSYLALSSWHSVHYSVSGWAHVTGHRIYKVMEQKQTLQRQPLFRNQMQQMRFSLSLSLSKRDYQGGADSV